MRQYAHFDGTRCKLVADTWVMTKLSPEDEKNEKVQIGDPCPYCNKYQDDTVRRGRLRYFVYRMRSLARLQITSGAVAFILEGMAIGQVLSVLSNVLAWPGWAQFIAVLAPTPLALMLGYLALDWEVWNHRRKGQPYSD